MADLFPWKLQKLKIGGRGGGAHADKTSLPTPPPGKEWHQDAETKEWRLVAKQEKESGGGGKPPRCGGVALGEQGSKTTPPATAPVVVDCLPGERGGCSDGSSHREDEWEFLSDHCCGGSSSVSSPHVLVARAGSVRSIASVEEGETGGSSSHRSSNMSVPFKFQRTTSSSTIDSCDNALGPAGKGVLGVDYVEHVILPTDTLQGICLAYKINSTKLRQANHFSGNSLLLAPKKLVIPLSKKALRSGYIRAQDTASKEYKLHFFLAEFELSMTEAKAYLELSNWDLKEAIQSVKEDRDWEEMDSSCTLKAGEIRIRMSMNKDGVPVGYSAQGAGIQPKGTAAREANEKQREAKNDNKSTSKKEDSKVTACADIPAIATKTVKASDVYKAASQHDNCGFELKLIPKKKDEEQPSS